MSLVLVCYQSNNWRQFDTYELSKMDLTAGLPRQVAQTVPGPATPPTSTTSLNEDTLRVIRVWLYDDLVIRWQFFNLNRKQTIIRSGKILSLRVSGSSNPAPRIQDQFEICSFGGAQTRDWRLRSVRLPSFLNCSKNVKIDFYWS